MTRASRACTAADNSVTSCRTGAAARAAIRLSAVIHSRSDGVWSAFSPKGAREVGRIASSAVDDKEGRGRRPAELVDIASDRLDAATAVRDEQHAAADSGGPLGQFLNTLNRRGMAYQFQGRRPANLVGRPRITQRRCISYRYR
jgi:hypothetical protein